MYVCMYVCMHVCMYVRIHVRMHVSVSFCLGVGVVGSGLREPNIAELRNRA